MGTTAPRPWDQRETESQAAYGRFLTYRNLGPTRSLDAAYEIHRGVPKGAKRPKRRPGCWQRDCKQFEWKARAEAWDVFVLWESSGRVVVAVVRALEAASAKVLAGLLEPESKPEGWSEQLEGLMRLVPYVPPDLVKAVQAQYASAGDTVGSGPGLR